MNGIKTGGVEVETVLGEVAHGGFVVARIDGKVTFVTGGLPGERVRVEITERGSRFDRGRVSEVLEPHPERVTPPCAVAEVCGGCDWQHASAEFQLELKRRVVAEQLVRLAGLEWSGVVEQVLPTFGWRTRMRYSPGPGLLGKRSHDVVRLPAEGCLIAAGPVPDVPVERDLSVTDAASGRSVFADGRLVAGEAVVVERAMGREFRLAANGFWQIHPRAADTLAEAVLAQLEVRAGENAVDLYCGAGLFAGALARQGALVLGVELSRRAVQFARRNVPEAHFVAANIDRFLSGLPARTDVVVLDPPRRGAGRKVVAAVVAMRPRAVSYVACDPAAFARDLGYFAELGYATTQVRAFDLFPQTHHVECVARLAPG
ncbi:class I SAM-dependent RNA methyltransferase [Tessaracoccus sp. OH4464_COT-324]|uniref:class I SAM-dependent RNA methyltransferase n=1 Tax=Tessaracoccus sp. OH4464_COT-324 TaxID=2491059 RepID=UPI001F33F4AC|nr:methyltransferase [Tessaracoccus sp. OH4464_COT-324]